MGPSQGVKGRITFEVLEEGASMPYREDDRVDGDESECVYLLPTKLTLPLMVHRDVQIKLS